MENVIIIGSGCAGWTSAIYTARANLKPLLLTGGQPGGLLTTTGVVENFPGFPEGIDGVEMMMRMQKQAERFGTRVEYGVQITKVDFSKRPFKLWADDQLFESQTVIIAVGASHRHLGVPGETELERKGVTYCATCDGALPVFRNQPLVVVGGGDSACEEATYLTHFGSKVYLIHRRDQLRAEKYLADRLIEKTKGGNVTIEWRHVLDEVLGDETGVTGIRIRHTSGSTKEIPLHGVFIAIGHKPNTDLFRDQLDMENGYIRTKCGADGNVTATSIEGVFAAGDVQDPFYRQAITSAGTGCMAALDAERYLDMLKS